METSDFEKAAITHMQKSGGVALAEKFGVVIRYLNENPFNASNLRQARGAAFGSPKYLEAAANQFIKGRVSKSPAEPTTIPDDMVSFILENYFGIAERDLERIKKEHALSMAAENIVGDLLERYLADELEKFGWVWVSGALIRGGDFILPPQNGIDWVILQVKNRDNSENSSSAAIREGTNIEKWHRTFSRRPGYNWDNFPHISGKESFSEQGFRDFVKKYLSDIKVT